MQFDNPDLKLKAAIRRSVRAETAPQSLRLKVARTIRETARPPTSKKAWGPRAWRGAAVIALVSLGALAVMLYDRNRPAMDDADLLAVLDTHDHCCNTESHHLSDLSSDDWAQMGRQLSNRLNLPVFLADLRTERWAFRGASICQIKGTASAHLVFSDECRRVSVFSIPIQGVPGARPNTRFSQEIRGHIVVGVVNDKTVDCMVGHCPDKTLSRETLEALFERHRNQRIAFGEMQPLAAR